MNYSGGGTTHASSLPSKVKKSDKKLDPNSLNEDAYAELVAAAEEEKNWKGICIAVFVIATICSLIVTSIVILTPGDEGPRVKHPRLRIQEIVSQLSRPKDFDSYWLSDKEVIWKNSDGAIAIFDASKNKSHSIVPNATIRQYNVQKYSLSADKRFVLLVHDIKPVFHYSYTAKYKIYNISNENVFPLEAPGGNQELQYAEFGLKGNQLVFVYQNNIYYYAFLGDNLKQLTKSGKEGTIYNGVTDWLYGEKIWKSHKALWFSSDGNNLCFASFDDTRVDVFTYPKYGPTDDTYNVYPEIVTLRYPKAGRENPSVSLWMIDLKNPNDVPAPQRLLPPSEIMGRDHYLATVTWIDKEHLMAIWMQREQNYSVVSLCDAERGWICEKNLEEESDSNSSGWVDLFDPPIITSDKRHYLLRLPVNDGKNGAFRQIAMITINGKVKNFITVGHQDVCKILAHRHETHTVFYLGTSSNAPGERHIYSIPDVRGVVRNSPFCLTCNQTSRNCTYHDAIFSPKSDYFIVRCLGPGVPWTELRAVDGNKILRMPEDKALLGLVNERAFPQLRTLTVPIGEYVANVRLLLPPVLREHEELKFPLVVEIGSDPGNQEVHQKFGIDWGNYLASSRDFIYAHVDVRGSSGRGDKLLHETWHKIGSVEVEDYLNVVKYLKNELHYIDKIRTAIWGWSYGAYVAATALTLDEQVFNCSIAVAPITNWLYVDSFTSERYFGLPWSQGSYIRYEKADLLRKADKFKDRKLYILHGTADDAVHLQHSFAFMKALNSAGVLYRTQLYPDSNHYLDDVRLHLYYALESYLNECFAFEHGHDVLGAQLAKKEGR